MRTLFGVQVGEERWGPFQTRQAAELYGTQRATELFGEDRSGEWSVWTETGPDAVVGQGGCR